MSRERRPNLVRVRFDAGELKEEMLAVGIHPDDADKVLLRYYARRANGRDKPCQSEVHHGPGHQSSTYCEITGGPTQHDDTDGVLTHAAGNMEWTDERPYSDEGWF